MITDTDERGGLPSASSAYIFYNCPGSLNLQRTVIAEEGPEVAPEVETIEGEEIHSAMEDDDFNKLDESGRNIAMRIGEMVDQAFTEWSTGDQAEIYKEKRLWIRNRTNLEPIASAKLDWFAVDPLRAVTIDYKSGYLPVTEARRNIQVRIQALAVWHEYPHLESITAGTAHYRFARKLDTVIYDQVRLHRAEQELHFKLWMAADPTASRIPGDWCRYCRAKAHCPEAAAYAMLPVAMTPADITAKNVHEMVVGLTPEQLAMLHDRANIIGKILDAVSNRLRQLPIATLNSVGWTLGKPSQVRVVKNVDQAKENLMAHALITEEEFEGCKKVVFGNMEELALPRIKEAGNLTEKKAKDEFNKILGEAIDFKPSAAPLRRLKEKD